MVQKLRYLPILLLCYIAPGSTTPSALLLSPDASSLSRATDSAHKKILAGALLLGVEYAVGPAVAYQAWWNDGFNRDNPFNHVGEEEPYHEDNAWHFFSCTLLSDYHYLIFSRYLRVSYPVAASAGLTFFTFTGVECLDAIERTGKWRFSIGDEVANCLGIGFWIFKMYFPSFPLFVRVGIRDWREIRTLAGDVALLFKDYDDYFSSHSDHYALGKVDCIYKVYDELYCGVSLSKEKRPGNRDLWGITAGYDVPMVLNKRKKGWWNPVIKYVSRYGDFLLSFTYWVQ